MYPPSDYKLVHVGSVGNAHLPYLTPYLSTGAVMAMPTCPIWRHTFPRGQCWPCPPAQYDALPFHGGSVGHAHLPNMTPYLSTWTMLAMPTCPIWRPTFPRGQCWQCPPALFDAIPFHGSSVGHAHLPNGVYAPVSVDVRPTETTRRPRTIATGHQKHQWLPTDARRRRVDRATAAIPPRRFNELTPDGRPIRFSNIPSPSCDVCISMTWRRRLVCRGDGRVGLLPTSVFPVGAQRLGHDVGMIIVDIWNNGKDDVCTTCIGLHT